MYKVLRIANRFNLGGPSYNVALLTKFLGDPFETLLIGGAIGENEESSDHILQKYGLEPMIIDEMVREINPKLDVAAYKRLVQLIKDYKPDVVHTHASKAGALGRLAAYNCGVPVIVHTFHGHVFHSYFGKTKTLFYKKVERYMANRSSAIIAISDQQKHELTNIHKVCEADKTHVIPLGFDLSRFRENLEGKRIDFRKTYDLKDDEIAIGIIGRLVPIKNHKMFLDALNIVLKNTKQKVKAFIIGDGEESQSIKEYSNQLGFKISTSDSPSQETNLIFTSWIKDVDRAYAGLDIVALTSLNEGTPVSLIEAQATDKPIVSTKVGGVEDVVAEGKTALLCPSGDTPTFAQNLLQLTENEELRHQMSTNGWEHVRERYHYERLVNDMRDLYLELLPK